MGGGGEGVKIQGYDVHPAVLVIGGVIGAAALGLGGTQRGRKAVRSRYGRARDRVRNYRQNRRNRRQSRRR